MTLCTQWPWKPTRRRTRNYIIPKVEAGWTWKCWNQASYAFCVHKTTSAALLFKYRWSGASLWNNVCINVQQIAPTPAHTGIKPLLPSVINLCVHTQTPYLSAPPPQEHCHDNRFHAGKLFAALPFLLGTGSQLWTPCDLLPPLHMNYYSQVRRHITAN